MRFFLLVKLNSRGIEGNVPEGAKTVQWTVLEFPGLGADSDRARWAIQGGEGPLSKGAAQTAVQRGDHYEVRTTKRGRACAAF